MPSVRRTQAPKPRTAAPPSAHPHHGTGRGWRRGRLRRRFRDRDRTRDRLRRLVKVHVRGYPRLPQSCQQWHRRPRHPSRVGKESHSAELTGDQIPPVEKPPPEATRERSLAIRLRMNGVATRHGMPLARAAAARRCPVHSRPSCRTPLGAYSGMGLRPHSRPQRRRTPLPGALRRRPADRGRRKLDLLARPGHRRVRLLQQDDSGFAVQDADWLAQRLGSSTHSSTCCSPGRKAEAVTPQGVAFIAPC